MPNGRHTAKLNFAVCPVPQHTAKEVRRLRRRVDGRPLVFAVCRRHGTRQKTTFAVCPPFDTRQTRIHGPESIVGPLDGRYISWAKLCRVPQARHTAKGHLCRVPQARHTAKGILCRVLLHGTRQSKFFFILLFPNSFMWYRGCIWDLILKMCAFLGKFAIF